MDRARRIRGVATAAALALTLTLALAAPAAADSSKVVVAAHAMLRGPARAWEPFDDGWSRLLQSTQVSCAAQQCASLDECACVPVVPDKPTWQVVLEWLVIVLLVAMSALFSGLTLGLMSLDKIGLEIVIGGDPGSRDAQYARKIQPIREKGNLLLCTLLLGNVSVNTALSILLADYTSGVVGFLMSTVVIVVFGEIFPQAACSRHALLVGAHTIWIVKFFIVIMYPLTRPLSWVLDHIFKEDVGSIYSSQQLSKLVEIHAAHHTLDEDQAKMMGGAIQFKAKTVSAIMTPRDKVFALPADKELDFAAMSHIFELGYSRIPVFESADPSTTVGLLLTKDLILIDPDDCTTVGAVMRFFGRPVQFVEADMGLPQALTKFRTSGDHMAVVRVVDDSHEDRDPFFREVGLVTLEDIIEVILQQSIVDETDSAFEVARSSKDPSARLARATFDFTRLRLLDQSRKSALSSGEVRAIAAHLSTNVAAFRAAAHDGRIAEQEQVERFVAGLDVLTLKRGEALYIKGKPVTHCTLVLAGKLDVVSGSEGFHSVVGPWSFVGEGALDPARADGYIGDFSATVTSDDALRCVRFNRRQFDVLCLGMPQSGPGSARGGGGGGGGDSGGAPDHAASSPAPTKSQSFSRAESSDIAVARQASEPVPRPEDNDK